MKTNEAKELIKRNLDLMLQLTLKEEFYKVKFLLNETIKTINESFNEEEYLKEKQYTISYLFTLKDDFENYIDGSLRRKFNNKVHKKNVEIVTKIINAVRSLVEK